VSETTVRGAADCRACGAELREGVRFCPSCGSEQAAPPPRAPAPAPPPAPPAPAPTPAPTPGPVVATQSFLLPRVPCKLVWSPRKAWVVTTSLSDDRISDLFVQTMTKQPSLLRRTNSYFRRVSWQPQRNAISGQIVATCRASGPVSVGFGRMKQYVDVSGDTILCGIEREHPQARATVSAGVGTYTTYFGFYAFPATAYTFDFVKALKQADALVEVRYPWSVVRIVSLAVFLVWLLIVAAGG
jgi:hypothetical protein